MTTPDCRFSTQRVEFDNGRGDRLIGVIDCPDDPPRGWLLLNHCFTCGKDLKSLRRIARRLAAHGYGCLRFDATGLGQSGGDFSRSTLTTLIDDSRAAVAFMSQRGHAPRVLFGHSLGAIAALAATTESESVRGVVTLASSAAPGHLRESLERRNPAIRAQGIAEVEIGGQRFTLRRELLDDLDAFDMDGLLARLDRPVLLLHGDEDELTPIEHGRRLFERLRGPRSFMTLPGGDHLLMRRETAADLAADWIALWTESIAAS